MLKNVKVLYHASIVLYDNIYIDPYKIENETHNAKYLFITHSHYDHFSIEDIEKVRNEDTIFFVTPDCKEKLLEIGVDEKRIVTVAPDEMYRFNKIEMQVIPAYNVNKEYHKKEYGWVGYLIKINGVTYYITGDTDVNEDIQNIKCDVLFVPIGGTYTMDYKEAADYTNSIKPKYVIPIHYGTIVGKKEDGIEFAKLLDTKIECLIFNK
jgi:L-ascorbate metabolism protein UlaG (beta-lactamase superfamily)